MLFKNDIFDCDGVRLRFLADDLSHDTAWVIDMNDRHAWPVCLPYSEIKDLTPVPNTLATISSNSPARLARCNLAWDRLQPIIAAYPTELYVASFRKHALSEHAKKVKCSERTLYKDLRRYWQRGQTKHALMPDYCNSGRRAPRPGEDGELQVTAGRGRKPSQQYDIYQVTKQDTERFDAIIRQRYLSDERITMQDTYDTLIKLHYCYQDGNGQLHVLPKGSRPTLRQLRHYLKKHFDIEEILRKRGGDSDFERLHRKKLGSVLADCQGVGHYYEIDATIADIYLVSSVDPTKIIGKPTLYLIIDRKSSLIAGFYFGLENASWNGALQTILSISEDKQALCERYGVTYDPRDWPAHQVFPMEFLADRGDMISQPSSNIAEGLHVTVTNLPGKRPDWKPLVECGFRQLHNAIRPIAPAYDPPSNATRRRGKHYDKDACLTIKDFGNLILNAIIAHNRREILDYPLSPKELLDGVRPCPIELWNHGIVTRSGSLARYTEETVRFALLRKKQAFVTARGVELDGCYYTFPKAIEEKWFEMARKKHFRVTVSYDSRLVDTIYVHPLLNQGEPYVATLTDRSTQYAGMSFDEVAHYQSLRAAIRYESEHSRLENKISLQEATGTVVTAAKQKLKDAPKKARSSRRADVKPAREHERSIERKTLAAIPVGVRANSLLEHAVYSDQEILNAEVTPLAAAYTAEPPTSLDKPSSLAERLAHYKARMRG